MQNIIDNSRRKIMNRQCQKIVYHSHQSMAESASVRVLCRFRPINARERREFIEAGKDPEQMICKFIDEYNLEVFLEAGLGSKKYCFDRVYQPGVPQRDVYNLAANDTVIQILNGYNGTILSYGQTGAGKSFSMFGADIHSEDMKGIIPRAGDHIFRHIATCDNKDIEFSVRCSFLEIYNESVNDLLARGPEHENLKIRETPERGIFVENAQETQVDKMEDMMTVITIGDANRSVSSTNMNAVSSRSHTVIMIFVGQVNRADESKQNGKLCLVDLAGSEKTSKTAAEGQRLVEANNINASLTTLGQCIKMLADGDSKGHIPYRQSKLTRLLQESLGGNSKTTLLIACSPHPFNREETISTCEFGKRAKAIKNKVKVNATKSVKELMAIIDKLQIQINGMQRYIDMQAEVIKYYQENAAGVNPTCYVPTPKDLELLKAGKKLAIDGGDADAEGETTETSTGNAAHVDINGDASLRIAQLQSQIEKEQEKSHMMKENYEADIKDLERKLADALQGGGTIVYQDGGGERKADQSVLLELKQIKAERDAYKKQLLIAMGEEVDENEEPEDEYEDEYEYEDEESGAESGRDEVKPAAKTKVSKIEVPTIQFGGKKLQALQKQVEDLTQANQELTIKFESATLQNTEKVNQLNEMVRSLQKECNRLRGISNEDENDRMEGSGEALQGLDEKDKTIRILEKELRNMREIILVQKSDGQKVKLLEMRLNAANDRYVKGQAQIAELEDKLKQASDTGNLAQQNIKLERMLQFKTQDMVTLQQRVEISEQRIAHLTKQLLDVNTTITRLKKEKHDVQKQKEMDVQRLINDFEKQKAKLQENMISKGNVYRPVIGGNIAITLAQTNPEILEKLKSFKQRWVESDD